MASLAAGLSDATFDVPATDLLAELAVRLVGEGA